MFNPENLAIAPKKTPEKPQEEKKPVLEVVGKKERKEKEKWTVERIKECIQAANEFAKNKGKKLTPSIFNNKKFYEIFKGSGKLLNISGFDKNLQKQLEQMVQERNEELINDKKLKCPENIEDLIILLFGKESKEFNNFERQEQKEWNEKRAEKAIRAAYDEYVERKKSVESIIFNRRFFIKSNNDDVKKLGDNTKDRSKTIFGTEMDLQQIIEKIFGKDSEIYKAFEKVDNRYWTEEQAKNAIQAAYDKYVERKKIDKDVIFNTNFFIKSNNYYVKNLGYHHKLYSKTIFGTEMDLQQIIEKIFGKDSEIYKAFEKEKHEEWTKDRAINAIQSAYDEYIERKEAGEDVVFNTNFFIKSNDDDVRKLGERPRAYSKTIFKEEMDLQQIIEKIFGEDHEMYNNFERQEQIEWNEERAKNAIQNAYDEYMERKELGKTVIFSREFFRKSNNDDVRKLGNNHRDCSKKIFKEEMDLQQLIKNLFGENSEIYKAFEKKEQENWTKERAEKAIQAAYDEYNQKKESGGSIVFNGNFFEKSNNDDIRKIGHHPESCSKTIFGSEMDLQQIIKNLFEENSEIYKAFEKQEIWTKDRAINVIQSAYDEYIERKEAGEDVVFNTNFFIKSINNDVKNLGSHCNLYSKAILGSEMDLQQIIKKLFGENSDIYKPFKMSIGIAKENGHIFQYSLENILILAENENLEIEPRHRGYGIPDLIYSKGEKPLVFDIKLQTTTYTIPKDVNTYSKLISEKFITEKHPNPEERKKYLQEKYSKKEPIGYVAFITLNGYDKEKETVEMIDKETNEKMIIGVKYYKALDFIKRILKDNKRLINFISGEEKKDQGLTEEERNKIIEIKETLEKLKHLVQSNLYSTKEGLSLEDAAKRYKTIREKYHKLAKSKDKEKILQTDFKGMFDL